MSNGSGQNIIEKIIADAKVEAKEIHDKAQREADALLASANQAADKKRVALLLLTQAEVEKAVSKEISGAVIQAKKRILQTKQECLEDILSTAKQRLYSLKGKEYETVILSMLEQAEKGETIIFSAKDREHLVTTVTEKGYSVSDETREVSAGFVVKKGDIEYNYTFEAIMAIQREEIEKIAAEILFA